MRSVRRTLCFFAAILALILLPAPAAQADDTRCVGVLPPGVYDNVVVPEGASCTINNANIKGNVLALPSSTLLMWGSSRVAGNVQSDKAENVQVSNVPGQVTPPNVILGDITFSGATLAAVVCNAVLPNGNIAVLKSRASHLVVVGEPTSCGGNIVEKGNITVEDNVATDGIIITKNEVAQNLQVIKNRSTGDMSVTRNVVGANLQCFENTGVFVGGPNSAQKAEGQCF